MIRSAGRPIAVYEEGERVDELVEVVEGVEDLGEVLLSKLRNWMVKRNIGNQNGNLGDENVQSNVRDALVDNNQVGCQLVTLRSMMERDVL